MEINIEIGTEKQKHLIEQELELIKKVVEECKPPINLSKIIVPSDFEAKINELEGIETYKAVRGLGSSNINANARIVKLNDGYAIVISPNTYSDFHDTQTRYFIALHELFHIINKRDFPKILEDSYVKARYLDNIYSLYDEYSSDRFAYSLVESIFPSKSKYWKKSVDNDIEGFIGLINDSKYYDSIRHEIEAFRTHAEIEIFCDNTREYIDELAISLAHIFSLFHHYPDKISRSKLLESPFVNEKTFNLMEYYKDKYEQKNTDLFDGIELIIDFMMNFGFKFEHRNYGGYCHVLDI